MMTAVVLGFWGLVAWDVVTLARSSSTPRSTAEQQLSAQAILDQRSARGEIDEDEYRRRRSTLRAS